MIDTIIFDLDGVLIESKNIHFETLNKALKLSGSNCQISYNQHLYEFDGLPTKKKLKILNDKNLVNKKLNNKIINIKNKITTKLLSSNIKYSKDIYKMFNSLSQNYKIGIATNAIQSTLELVLKKLKIKKFINYSISSSNLKNPKPHPEIYLKLMVKLNCNPKNTLIIEDSHFGRTAAKDSGAQLMPIKDLKDVKLNKILNFIKQENKIDYFSENRSFWEDKDINIVIPMAGEGSRFLNAGYTFPKPLIEIKNKTMIQIVVDSLGIKGNFIFIVRKEHLEKYNLKNFLNVIAPNCKVIVVDRVTQGAACTVLLSKKYIDNDKPLIIANSDQYVEWNPSETMYNFVSKKIDGGILTFKALHPKWSYAKIDEAGNVIEVAEKKVISNHATTGIYYWKKGNDFVKYANMMIKKNIRVNNEFYVCPVYNQAIKEGKIIKIHEVSSMWGLGTPEDLKFFLEKFKKF